MKTSMPFAPRGGCYVHEGDALVRDTVPRHAIVAPADGTETLLIGDPEGVITAPIEPTSDDGVMVDMTERESDGDGMLPPLDAEEAVVVEAASDPATRCRKRHK